MTTIAYKDGFIATDGQSTCGDIILSSREVKRHEHDGAFLFLCGSVTEMEEFVTAWPNGAVGENCCPAGFVVKGETLWATTVSDDKVATWKHDPTIAWAYGSGSQFAIGAMDAGYSARQAVAIAKNRDTGTGGTIRVYDAKTGEEV